MIYQKKIKRFMNDQVFIDTSAFKGLVDLKDEFHKKAVQIWHALEKEDCNLVTTNYVLDESFTLIRARCGTKIVDSFRGILVRSPNLRVVRVTVSDEALAWNWFTKNWSKLSFTDCVSFAVMERLKLNRVITFDSHFKQAGFKLE